VGPTSVVTLVFALLGFWTVVLNLWLFWARPGERSHLWLAVASTGLVCEALANAALYRADTLAEAQRAQVAALLGSLPMAIGMIRFTGAFLRVELGLFWRAYTAYVTASVLLLCSVQSLFFGGRAVEVELSRFAQPFVRAELSSFALILIASFVPLTLAIVVTFMRHRRRIEQGGRPLLLALLASLACVVNDVAVMSGSWDGPLLASFGLCAFSIVFTGLLLRRAMRAMLRVGADAEALQLEARARAEQLREKDHRLAHGARLAAMGSLAGGIARELDGPISFVARSLDQVADSWRDADDAVFAALMRENRSQLERVRQVVAELLRLSRRAEGPAEPVDLERVVAAVLLIARPEARSRARLAAELAEVPPVLGEARLLTQIVLNLVVMALDAIPQGDPERYEVVIGTALQHDRVLLTVRHNGPELATEQLSHLFDPALGNHGELSTARLGLSVARQLAVRHGGSIDVESRPGATTFRVALPPTAVEHAAT